MNATRRTRWLIVPAAAILLLVGLAAAAYWLILPHLVRSRVRSTLDQAGLRDVRFNLRHAGLWGSALAEVTDGSSRIEQVRIDYHPSILWTGTLDGLAIDGAEFVLRLDNGPSGTRALRRPPARQSANPAPIDLPPVRITSSALVLATKDDRLRLTVRGELLKRPDGSYSFDALLATEPRPVHVTGELNRSGDLTKLAARSDSIDARILQQFMRLREPSRVVELAGRLNVAVEFTRDGADRHLSVRVQPAPTFTIVPANLQVDDGVLIAETSLEAGAQVRVENFAVSTRDGEFIARGVSGQVALANLWPVTTATPAQLAVRQMQVGQIQLADGSIRFAVDRPEELSVGQTNWNWLGGTIRTDPFAVKLAEPTAQFVLHADGVQLAQLLELFAEKRAGGAGKLDGRLAVGVDESGVWFGDGWVKAEGHGSVQIRDLPGLKQALAAGQRRADSPQLKSLVMEALSDFEYRALTAELKRTDDDLMAEVFISGRGRSGARPQVDYTLRLHGLGDLLRLYLGVQRQLTPTQRGGEK